VRLATRLRTLERRAGAEARQAALCGVCGGLGRHNALSFTNGVPQRDEPPEPCPGCGKVRMMHIHLTVCDRITATPQPLVVVGRVGGGEAA
jgi:rubrerythrin